jgi:trigger factor
LLLIFSRTKRLWLFIGKKVVCDCKYKGLFEDDHQLMDVMKVNHDDVHGLEVDVNFTIEAINTECWIEPRIVW